jgi:hypothetical protein
MFWTLLPWLLISLLLGVVIGLMIGLFAASALARGHYAHFLSLHSEPGRPVFNVLHRSSRSRPLDNDGDVYARRR